MATTRVARGRNMRFRLIGANWRHIGQSQLDMSVVTHTNGGDGTTDTIPGHMHKHVVDD